MRIQRAWLVAGASTLLMLQGCNIGVNYRSNPPGAFLTYSGANNTTLLSGSEGKGYAPLDVYYSQTEQYKSGGCMSVSTPIAMWPDGSKLDSQQIEVCKNKAGSQSFLWAYVLTKPSSNQQFNQPTTTQYLQTPSQGMDLNQAKNKCNELGFKMGTEAFGNCVLKMSK